MTTNQFKEPFYTVPESEVTEDHARHIILHQYTSCVRVTNQWAVPLDSALVWLDVPAIVDALVGSVMWNPTYGYFKVTAFDKQAQRIQVQRKAQSAAPGTVVAADSRFIFVSDQEYYWE